MSNVLDIDFPTCVQCVGHHFSSIFPMLSTAVYYHVPNVFGHRISDIFWRILGSKLGGDAFVPQAPRHKGGSPCAREAVCMETPIRSTNP